MVADVHWSQVPVPASDERSAAGSRAPRPAAISAGPAQPEVERPGASMTRQQQWLLGEITQIDIEDEAAEVDEAPEADTDPASPSHRVQSVEFSDEPPSMMVSTGCSSTAAHPTFLAALLALVGLLLPRRRS